jgi:hypothetical protein
MVRQGQVPMSSEQLPPRQLQLWPVLARMTQEVMVPLLLQVAVRVNVTCPSHALPHEAPTVPGQLNDWLGQTWAAASIAPNSAAVTIASRTR